MGTRRHVPPYHGVGRSGGGSNHLIAVIESHFRHLAGHVRDIGRERDRRRRAEAGAVGWRGQDHACHRIEQLPRDDRAGLAGRQVPIQPRRGGLGLMITFHLQAEFLAGRQGDFSAVVP